jgi:hypothetical protein
MGCRQPARRISPGWIGSSNCSLALRVHPNGYQQIQYHQTKESLLWALLWLQAEARPTEGPVGRASAQFLYGLAVHVCNRHRNYSASHTLILREAALTALLEKG